MSTARHLRVLSSNTEADFEARAIRVAFTSSNMKEVDQHFGAAESVVIYGVDMERAQLLEVTEFEPIRKSDSEEKLPAKFAALEGCVAVYTIAVGTSAVNQLKAKGIQPVKVTTGVPIADLIGSLQDELRMGPSAWLARAIDLQGPRGGAARFAEMEAEGWDE